MFNLYLIRHGQTERNAQGRYPLPDEDPPLSTEGQAQAQRLNAPPVQAVWSSPARRCLETAALAGYAELIVSPALLEARFGVMAGRTWAELETEYGNAPRTWIDALADLEADAGPPGGETGQQFHGRVRGWLDTLPDNGAALAFTHAGVVLAALRLTVGLGAATVQHARVTHLRRDGGAWWLAGLNI
ncbi:histidine phosphatase family protein [Deinococcus sp.]|uniref:histidine phosphatase family protein n=1 Tax=Deinococcus sp. TaxID=47478 RepID=UPI003B59DCBC